MQTTLLDYARRRKIKTKIHWVSLMDVKHAPWQVLVCCAYTVCYMLFVHAVSGYNGLSVYYIYTWPFFLCWFSSECSPRYDTCFISGKCSNFSLEDTNDYDIYTTYLTSSVHIITSMRHTNPVLRPIKSITYFIYSVNSSTETNENVRY